MSSSVDILRVVESGYFYYEILAALQGNRLRSCPSEVAIGDCEHVCLSFLRAWMYLRVKYVHGLLNKEAPKWGWPCKVKERPNQISDSQKTSQRLVSLFRLGEKHVLTDTIMQGVLGRA